MQVQFTAKAYLSKYHDIADVASGDCLPQIIAAEQGGYYEQQGFSLIGNATVTVELHTENDIAAAKLAALKSELQVVRAENQQRENAILDKISKLTAISCDESF